MRRFAALALALALTGAWPSAAQPTPPTPPIAPPAIQPSVTLPPDLARVLTDYEKAWSAKDPAALARLFAEDGFVLPNGSGAGARPGRDRVVLHRPRRSALPARDRLRRRRQRRLHPRRLCGSIGQADDGKFTLTLRKGSDGRWLIVSDMDNANRRRE